MNMFILSTDLYKCAALLHDKHCVKMVLEQAQLLCNAHHYYDSEHKSAVYKATHINHPCSVWVREGKENYSVAYSLFFTLANEYHRRYFRKHKSYVTLSEYLKEPPSNMPELGVQTPPPLCMPDEYKEEGSIVNCYRAYYRAEKISSSSRWFRSSTVPEELLST